MARLSDVPKALSSVGVIAFAKRIRAFAKRIRDQVNEHRLGTWASALAYSWLMAVFPFFIFLLTLLPYLPQQVKDRAKREVQQAVYQTLPRDAANTVWQNIDQNLNNLLHQKEGKAFVRFLGIALALWAASAGMAMTMTALESCYDVKNVLPFWKQRLVALGLTLVVSVLMIIVVCLLPVAGVIKAWVLKQYPGMSGGLRFLLAVFDVVRWVLAVAFLNTVVAVVYHVAPGVKHRFHWLTPGAVFCIVVWVVLGLAFRLYVATFGNYDKTYGTAGGVVVLLIFFYIDAYVLLVGAEVNSEIDSAVLNIAPGTVDLRPAEDEVVAKEEAEAAEKKGEAEAAAGEGPKELPASEATPAKGAS
jgi:membrane protein